MLTKDDAEAIARKLKARLAKHSGAHLIHKVYVGETWVATVSIRHGFNRDLGHDHILRDIYESPRNAKQLALCPRTYEEWLQNMRDKGKLV